MYHNNTIRRYTSALIDIFNDLEVQHFDSKNNLITKKIPLVYKSREKSTILDDKETEQITKGNLNILPRARISIASVQRADDRMTNKYNQIISKRSNDKLEFSYNSVPYDFIYDLNIICRGMNEACMVLEQIAPKFNPTISLDIYDTDLLKEPTRVLIKMMDINFETTEFEETSINLVNVTVMIQLCGYLYQPIKTIPKISEFIINFKTNRVRSDSISGWDVKDFTPVNQENIYDDGTESFRIIDIVPKNVLRVGDNKFEIIVDDTKHVITSYVWTIKTENASIIDSKSKNPTIKIKEKGDLIISCRASDAFDNYLEFEKTFNV